MTALRYVYAVTRPFDGALADDVRGVAGAPPRLLSHEGLVAVVSHVPEEGFSAAALRERLEDLDWLTSTARGHDAVIGALTSLTTPLPLRLATVCRDDSGVMRLLDSGRERFVRALERLDGQVEWGVKVYADEGPAAASDRAPGGGGTAPTGRDYLRQRLQQRNAREHTWSQADAVARTLHTALSRCAAAGLLHRPQDARLPGVPRGNVLNAAYLVPREHSEAFVEEVRRLAPEDSGVRVELTGPWAPYSFAATTSSPEADGS